MVESRSSNLRRSEQWLSIVEEICEMEKLRDCKRLYSSNNGGNGLNIEPNKTTPLLTMMDIHGWTGI